MADLEKTVAILFKGVDEISGTMNTISGSLGTFGGKLEASTQPLANMALAVEKIDAALVVLAVGGMVASVSAAGRFQSGMNEIHTLLRESPEAIAEFDRSIEDYAINSTQSLEDIQKAIYQSLSANVSYSESVKFVSDAEKLAVAGKSTLTEAVDLLTSNLTAYGASWDQAGKYSDVFFKTVEIGKVTIPELSSSMAMVAPIAGAMGISIEEVSAAIAALTAGGLKAGPAAEYLRQAIQNVIDPSKESAGIMDELGIAYGKSAIDANGFSGAMADIWEKSKGNVDVLTKIFGNVQSLQVAMTLGSDQAGYYAKALKELADSAGATDRAYKIMVESFEYVNQRLVNTMKMALIDAGKPMLEDWANIADGLGKIFKGIDIGLKDGAFDEIYKAIDEFSKMFGDYLRDVAKNIPEAMKLVNFDEFLKTLRGLGASIGDIFKAMFGEIDLKTPEGLADAMQKVVDGITKLMQVSKGIADQLKPFAEELGKMADGALNADGKTAELAGNILGLGQGINTAISALNGIAPAMNIFSGALIVDSISNVGKLAATFPALSVAAAPVAAALGLGTAAIASMGLAAKELGVELPTLSQLFGIDAITYFANELYSAATASEYLVNKGLTALGTELPTLSQLFGIDAISYFAKELSSATTAAEDLVNRGLNALGTELPTISQLFGIDAISYFANALLNVADSAGAIETPAGVASASLGAIMHAMNDIPEIKTFTINSETGSATEKINTLNTSILSFPSDFKIEAQINLDETTYGAILTKMNDIPKEYSTLYSAEMDQESVSVISSMKEIPALKTLTVSAELKNEEYITNFMSEVSNPDTKDISINMDSLSFENVKNQMAEIVNPDGTKTWVNVGVDAASMERTQAALKEIPTEKILEIKLQGEIDKELTTIKANADTIQKAMEWKAKLDIATVEADAKRVEAAFASVSSEIGSLSNEIGDLFSKNWGDFDIAQFMAVRDAATQALNLQKEAHAANMKLVEEQRLYEIAKIQRMKSGKALITIDSTGLEPALEMIMWQIIQKVQLKANEDNASFLLGIPS